MNENKLILSKLILPIASCGKIIRKAGAIRVSQTAEIAMARILEEYGILITKDAIELVKHAKRTTLQAEDLQYAIIKLRK